MKRIFPFIRGFVLLAFLAGSLSVTVYRMVCLYGCSTEISLSEIEGCCKNEKPCEGVSFEKRCCDFSSSSFVLQDYFPIQYLTVEIAVSGASHPGFVLNSNELKSEFYSKIVFNDSSPPPEEGRVLLVQIQKFTI